MARNRNTQGIGPGGVFAGLLLGGAGLYALQFAPPIHGVKPAAILDVLSPMSEDAASKERHAQAITLSGKLIEMYQDDAKTEGVKKYKKKHGDTQEYRVVMKVRHDSDKGATRYIASTQVDAETKSSDDVVSINWEVQECTSSKNLSCHTVRQTRIHEQEPVNFWVDIGVKQPFDNWTASSDIPGGQYATFDDFSALLSRNG